MRQVRRAGGTGAPKYAAAFGNLSLGICWTKFSCEGMVEFWLLPEYTSAGGPVLTVDTQRGPFLVRW